MTARSVGWISDGEWAQVYKQVFYGTFEEKQHALQIMEVWRGRFSAKIPVAIEATYRLLETLLHTQDLSEGLTQQAMAAALLQFVGLITENSFKNKFVVIRIIGEDIGLPEWLMSLRNTMAHGPIPSCFMLDTAITFCWKWLKEKHWDKQAQYNSFCVQLPCMNANVTGQKPLTLEYEISSLLTEYSKQIDHRCADVIDIKSVLQSLCNDQYSIERLCVVFVLCAHYEFDLDLMNFEQDINRLTLPIHVVEQWKPLIICIAVSSLLPVLLYCFLHQLHKCDRILHKAKLALWSRHVLDVLMNSTKMYKHKNLIINECIKLVLCSNDAFSQKMYEKLSIYIAHNCSKLQLQKLDSLYNVFDSTSTEQSEIAADILTTSSVDEFIPRIRNYPQLKSAVGNDDKAVARDGSSTWSLYDGKSLKDCPIGLLPGQKSASLSQQLYGFSQWTVHKYSGDLKSSSVDNDDEELDYIDYAEGQVTVFSPQFKTKPNPVVDHEESSSNDELNDEIEDINFTESSTNGFNEFDTKDWNHMALTMDTF